VSEGQAPGRLAVVAHEIRSPVAALAAIAAAFTAADGARRARLLELAAGAVAGIERLLAEVSTVSLRLEQVDMAQLVVDAVETAALPKSGLSLGAEVEDGLLVEGDSARLRQVLDNLIGNAIGHSPPGGEVNVTAGRRETMIVVDVSDQGEGIAAADLERVFEQGVRLTSHRPGSGLGLAVARAIAQAHGGGVEVESTPGRGATFRLVLPGAYAVR
jgi:two-component system OmpR family sensor kinase